jgi:hypothetical protein
LFPSIHSVLVATGRWCKSACSCRVVRAVVFTRQQLCCPSAATLVSSSLSKVGQFSFAYCPLSHEFSSGMVGLLPHTCSQPLCLFSPLLGASSSFGWLAYHPKPAPSLYCFSHIHSLRVWHWEFGSLPHPHSLGRFSVPSLPSLMVLDYSLLFILFIFVGLVISLPRGCTWLCSWGDR